MPELFQVALAAWGKDGFFEAQRRFYAGHDLPDDPVGDLEFESLFITWFGLQFTPAGLQRLSALLDQFEWDTRAGQEIPVRRLRAALGL